MADALSTPAPSTPPRKKRRALRILGWTALSVFVLLVVAWFVLTSAPFFRKVVLPRVSDSINADVTVRDASIRPFSSVVLYDLKVHPRGEAPLLSAKQVRLRYSLFAILGGTVLVEEAFLDSPVITLVEDPDGRTNVDPLLQETEEEPAAETPQLDIRRVAISNAVVHYEKRYADSTRDTTAVSNLNVTLTGLKNGDSGRLAIAATVSMNSGWNAAAGSGSAGAAAGTLQASFNGDYTFALSPDLNPISIKGNSQFAVNRAEGTFADLSALGVDLVADVAPGQIIELALRFRQGETQLGALRANGPFSIEKMEGLVNVELTPIDRRV
ncbi:MAG TPA: hypothetical protein PKH32_12540, partial [Verrucomicrobiota bacterium]|nr:hypothetical protein [Verrucomicrobiota bacterium]